MHDIAIRTATPDDAARLVELINLGALVGGREDPTELEPYRAALAEIAADPWADVLVATVGGEVVAMCQVISFRHVQDRGGRCAELESMHTHPDWRAQGVGSQLLLAALAWAREHGCYRVQLTSNRKRPDAHRFYERHGFTRSHFGFKLVL